MLINQEKFKLNTFNIRKTVYGRKETFARPRKRRINLLHSPFRYQLNSSILELGFMSILRDKLLLTDIKVLRKSQTKKLVQIKLGL